MRKKIPNSFPPLKNKRELNKRRSEIDLWQSLTEEELYGMKEKKKEKNFTKNLKKKWLKSNVSEKRFYKLMKRS